jgi:membrane protease YdiL (CAAX protease family)
MTKFKAFNEIIISDKIRFPLRFFIITFIWSWGIWTPLILCNLKIIPLSDKLLAVFTFSLVILGAFGPLAGALLVLRKNEGKNSLKAYLKKFLDLNLGWKGYIMPIVIFGGSTFIAWFFPELYGERRLPMLLPSGWVFIPCLLFMIFLGGGQEEFGWRGYALPILENKYGIWLANIILGTLWACWHIPLWFITGTSQTYMNFGGFIVLLIGYSFIFSWVRNISGDKPFAGLYSHGVANAFISIMPTIVMQKQIPQPRYWIWVFLTFILGVLITMLNPGTTASHKNRQ